MSGDETENERKRLVPGERVGDHLVVRSVLGQGGTAVVYEALHTRLGASVALKVLDVPESFARDGALRMQREAEVCASIDDPHVPRIYDIDVLPDGTPYVVMEKVSGTTLEEMLADGPMPLQAVLGIADDLLAALEAVHRAGVVHRDIKPANLILRQDTDGTFHVRLMDFGVSKALCREPTDPKLTRAGMVVGTPHYMAPEQITGEAVDARADVYATGVVLFEMLSGRMPFEGVSTAEVVAAVLRHTPPQLSRLREGLPKSLESVVMQAMAPRPADRFLSVRDMRSALSALTDDEGGLRDSILSLIPRPLGFREHERVMTARGTHTRGSMATRSMATRRFSILGAGVAVVLGTMGFPGAAKQVENEEVSDTELEATGAAAGNQLPTAPKPTRVEPNAGQGLADTKELPVLGAEAVGPSEAEGPMAPEAEGGVTGDAAQRARFRYELLGEQRLQIASPDSLGSESGPASAQAAQPPADPKVLSPRTPESEEEARAERAARRKLREAERAMQAEEAGTKPGVLISDYVQQLDAIQQKAVEDSEDLPRRTESAPTENDLPVPPNPYPEQ
jgi:hypothetical protein